MRTDDEILKALDASVIIARWGNRLEARKVCGAIIVESQHVIASRKMLLRSMLYALLVAHGFRLLSRFVSATHGVSVRITLVQDDTGQPRMLLGPDRLRLIVDQRWLDELSPKDVYLYGMCDALIDDKTRSGLPPKLKGAIQLSEREMSKRETHAMSVESHSPVVSVRQDGRTL
jgi:hypothetical protein